MAVACGNAANTASESNFGRKIIDDLDNMTVLIATKRPCVWKIGNACSSTSPALNCQISTNASAFERRFSCVIIAPFERPVVPEV
jgi:hypothetical protein